MRQRLRMLSCVITADGDHHGVRHSPSACGGRIGWRGMCHVWGCAPWRCSRPARWSGRPAHGRSWWCRCRPWPGRRGRSSSGNTGGGGGVRGMRRSSRFTPLTHDALDSTSTHFCSKVWIHAETFHKKSFFLSIMPALVFLLQNRKCCSQTEICRSSLK